MSSSNQVVYARMERSLASRLKVICSLMIPLNLSIMLDMALLVGCLTFAGHVDALVLGAVGLGNSITYLMMVSFTFGFATSLDTLLTQQFGASNFDNYAMYFNKALVATFIISALFYPLFYFSEPILVFVGINDETAALCQQFCEVYYWAGVLWVQCNMLKIQLRAQRIVWPSIVGSMIMIGSFFTIMSIFSSIYGTSLLLIAWAAVTGYILQYIFLLVLFPCGVGEVRARRWCVAADMRHWGEFCKLAIPSVLIEIIEGYNFELVTLIVAAISQTALAAQNITGNISGIFWIFTAFGVATSLSIVIGNAMGMGKVTLAKRVAKQMCVVALLITGCMFVALVILQDQMLHIFTSDQEVIEAAGPAYFAMCICEIMDSVNWVAIGILKGLGKIRWLPLFQFIFYYLFHQPVSYVLVHFLGYGFETYWRMMIITTAGLATANFTYLCSLNWDKVAEEIQVRQNTEKRKRMATSSLEEPLV